MSSKKKPTTTPTAPGAGVKKATTSKETRKDENSVVVNIVETRTTVSKHG